MLRLAFLTILAVCALTAGCTTMGTGYDDAASGGRMLTFSWTSSDGGITGTMTASAPGGRSFSGSFLQPTRQTVAPIWYGENFYQWRDGTASSSAFRTEYSGSVDADLVDARGTHMRCRVRLLTAGRGMPGGGAGECRVDGDAPIEVRFPAA